jgi:hypothetical protein
MISSSGQHSNPDCALVLRPLTGLAPDAKFELLDPSAVLGSEWPHGQQAAAPQARSPPDSIRATAGWRIRMAPSTSLRHAGVDSHATIYDVARLAGVATSTVSRALAHPGRVSFRTAAHVRQVADMLDYRAVTIEPRPQRRPTHMLAMLIADLTNPVFHGMIRGAERTTAHAGYTLLILETRGSEHTERIAVERILAAVDGAILTSSRMSDGEVRELAKQVPLVTVDRIVGQVTAVMSDNVKAMKVATEHLMTSGVRAITYLAGPAGSWLDGMRWLALRRACVELDVNVRRIGPLPPSAHGGALAVDGLASPPHTRRDRLYRRGRHRIHSSDQARRSAGT